MKPLVSAAVMIIFSSVAFADQPVSTGFLSDVAIGGKDPVAYVSQASANSTEAVKGSKQFEFDWHGATWRFATAESRDKFAASPQRWVPEFNGHCANALSLGEGLVNTDGTVWQFFDDRLFLFYAERGLRRWQQGNYPEYLAEAEAAWRQLLGD